MTIQAIILDFDGLIMDTETPIFDAWRAAFRSYGHELGMEVWQRAIGTHGAYDPCAHLCELTRQELDHALLRQQVHEQHVRQCEAQPLLPGVRELLGDARALGLRTAVASSSSRGWVERWLQQHGIYQLLDTICGRDDVQQVKPAPELYLLAARRLAVAPQHCLVFEDSPNGMLAALRAGMRCVAVPNALTSQLVLPQVDAVLSSLAERPLAALIEQLTGAAAQPQVR